MRRRGGALDATSIRNVDSLGASSRAFASTRRARPLTGCGAVRRRGRSAHQLPVPLRDLAGSRASRRRIRANYCERRVSNSQQSSSEEPPSTRSTGAAGRIRATLRRDALQCLATNRVIRRAPRNVDGACGSRAWTMVRRGAARRGGEGLGVGVGSGWRPGRPGVLGMECATPCLRGALADRPDVESRIQHALRHAAGSRALAYRRTSPDVFRRWRARR